MTNDDPLRDLVVDSVEIDRQRIADALRGVVAIDKSGQVLPGTGFQRLDASQKILAFLLGRKVAVLLDMTEEEAIGPTELAKSAGMAPGTVGPTIRRIHTARLITQDVDSRYYLSPHQVGTAIEQLSDSEAAPPQEKVAAPRNATRRKPAATAARKSRRGRTKSESQDEGADRKRQSAGFSPTNAIRDLIAQGFFDQPKTLTQVQTRFKDKQGREIAVTTLSPLFTRLLRDGALDREKSDDGTYEYVKAQA